MLIGLVKQSLGFLASSLSFSFVFEDRKVLSPPDTGWEGIIDYQL